MEKIEIILTNCIEEIKAGKASVSDCLNRYPSLRQELEPLLKVALNVRQPRISNMESGDKQAAKAWLLQQIRTTGQKKAWSLGDILSLGVPARFAWARVAVSVVTIVIVLSLLAGGTAYASQSSLPGDLLYPVKTATEDARLIVAGDSADKADLNLRFARTRLEEMERLDSGDEDGMGIAVKGYRGNLEAAQEQIRNIQDAAALSGLLERALTDIQDQLALCDNLLDADPVYPERAKEACSLNINAQVGLLKMLEQQDTLKAAELNLNAMQNRLHRAQEKANENLFQAMEEALLQYQQFNRLGEEILEYARNTNSNDAEIEELSAHALSGYLNILDGIAREAPQEHRSAIEASRQQTLQHESHARNKDQREGQAGRGAQTETPGNAHEDNNGQGKENPPRDQEGDGKRDGGTQDNAPAPSSTPGGENAPDKGNRPGDETNPGGSGRTGTTDAPGSSPDDESDDNSGNGNGPDNSKDRDTSGRNATLAGGDTGLNSGTRP